MSSKLSHFESSNNQEKYQVSETTMGTIVTVHGLKYESLGHDTSIMILQSLGLYKNA